MRAVQTSILITDATWADAERVAPGCGAAWDAQGGPAWLADREASVTLVISKAGVAIGCGNRIPFGWAIYSAESAIWLFM